jgi:hypothetical protein
MPGESKVEPGFNATGPGEQAPDDGEAVGLDDAPDDGEAVGVVDPPEDGVAVGLPDGSPPPP